MLHIPYVKEEKRSKFTLLFVQGGLKVGWEDKPIKASQAHNPAVILATEPRNIIPKDIFTKGEKDYLKRNGMMSVSPSSCRGRISRWIEPAFGRTVRMLQFTRCWKYQWNKDFCFSPYHATHKTDNSGHLTKILERRRISDIHRF